MQPLISPYNAYGYMGSFAIKATVKSSLTRTFSRLTMG